MPAFFKLNLDRRHHSPKQKHKVTNWPVYEASLRRRGSLTVWFSDEAVAAWAAEPRTTIAGGDGRHAAGSVSGATGPLRTA